MSIYIQEVLGLLKRSKKKIKLDKMRDHFEFGKLYHNSTLNTGSVYSPKMEPFVIKWGDFICEATEDLTRTQPGSGNLGFVPVYTDPEGSCSWDTLKDSIITQNAIGDTISIGGNIIVNGTATVTSLTDNRIVIVGSGGLLEDDANFTMDGVLFTALVNVKHGVVTIGVPSTTTTLNSNIILNGPVTDSQGNIGQLSQVLVGLGDGRVVWSDDDVVEALTYGSLWQGNSNDLKQELAIGTADQILISDGVTFAWQDTIIPQVGFDTLPMSTTADWTQNYLNAFINLSISKASYTVVKGMTNLTDGQQGEVIAENVYSGGFLTDDVIRFPDGWGPVGGLYNNKVAWSGGIDNGYPTSTLLFGESIKFKYITYAIPGTNSKMLYWDACCKMLSGNTCPVASDSVQTIDENTVLTNQVTVVDDGFGAYGLTYTALTPPVNGTFTFNISTGAYVFTPDPNWYGTTNFTYEATDGYCVSNIATVTIIVLPIAESPIWTSTDPVTASTYPTLTGGDAWNYNWTTNDPDHPCNQLTYTFTSVPAAPWLTFTDNGNCTGTLSGTYPTAGGNYDVTLIVTDPDGNSDAQNFIIGGLAVSKDTYFVYWSDTSGSMDNAISVTAQMSSVPTVLGLSSGAGGGTTVFNFSLTGATGFVDDPTGNTSNARLCVRAGMTISGTGIPAGTTIVSIVGSTYTLSNTHTSPINTVVTCTMTNTMYVNDYANPTNFRNLLQDYYATAGTEASGNVDPTTNGRDLYDSHIRWGHSGVERQIDMLNNKGQGGIATFPSAKNVVFLAWGDESDAGYAISGTGAGTWGDRANTMVPNIATDVTSVKNYIATMEAAAGNNSVYRGIFFKVVNGDTPDLAPLLNDNGLMKTGGRTVNGFGYPPEALAYNQSTNTLYDQSNGTPTRITYSSNVTNDADQLYYYTLVKSELIAIGYTTL
jgi:hypothetical protein